jgi:hypothetical protein
MIWGMKAPNPVKVFIWRACQNILPTKDNLQKKGISLDPLCLFCKTEVETTKHILWDCPLAADVWGACGRIIQKSYVAGYSFAEVMEVLFDRCNGEDDEVYAETAKRIWFRRNSVVHEGEFIHPNEVIQIAALFINDYREAMKKMGEGESMEMTRVTPVFIRWVPPLSSFFKINCDMALDRKNGRMGIGLLIRDSNGNVNAAAIHVVDFLVDPVVGESMAVLKVVEFCKNRGLDMIMVEGDSLQVVNSINKPGLNWGKCGHIVADIHEVLRSFQM